MHIILVPRLMTGRWRRLLARGSDFYFWIDWPTVWDLGTHFEPMLRFVCFLYRSNEPKLGQKEKLLGEFQRALLGEGLHQASDL